MATFRKRNNRWQVQIRRHDAPFISRSFHLRADAEAWAREMEVKVDRGSLKDDPRILQRITLGEIITRYKDEISSGKAGAEIESIVLNAFLKEPLAQRRLSSIQPSDFAQYRDRRLKQVTGSTVRRQLTILQHAFDIATREWGIPMEENPLKKIARPKDNPARERRLRDGEYQRLMDAASKCRNKLIKPIIVIAIETAMRRGEILNIRKDHINLKTDRLWIPRTKTGTPRMTPLSSLALQTLKPLMNDINDGNDKIFPITPNAIRLAWEKIRLRARIEDLHFHDLRHEAVSRLFEQGLGVAHVAAISGHKDFRMLSRYTHLNNTCNT